LVLLAEYIHVVRLRTALTAARKNQAILILREEKLSSYQFYPYIFRFCSFHWFIAHKSLLSADTRIKAQSYSFLYRDFNCSQVGPQLWSITFLFRDSSKFKVHFAAYLKLLTYVTCVSESNLNSRHYIEAHITAISEKQD